MPVTFPAHQAAVLPIKLRWPNRSDATAMCVGAAAPDLLYPVPGLGGYGHSLAGVVLLAAPLTVGICLLLRWRSALGLFGSLPDAGDFRLHSYRVIVQRRPGRLTTWFSALVGAALHVIIDSFTHADRWGAKLLGMDSLMMPIPFRGEIPAAQVLQYVGHSLGSLAAIAMFWHIGKARRLDDWYGNAAVESARAFSTSAKLRFGYWASVFAVTAVVAAALVAGGGSPVFSTIDGFVVGVLLAGAVNSPGSHRSATRSVSERESPDVQAQ